MDRAEAVDTAMIFCPPEPPVRLDGPGPFVIGRSRGCTLRVAQPGTSRHHAEIAAAGGGYEIRDLKSTNGTWVNGERLEAGRALHPGDRIEIAGCTITFCHVIRVVDTAGDATPANDQTLFVGRPVPTEAFRGELSQVPMFAVLQMLEVGRNSGVLEVDSEGAVSRLWFDQGAPVHAETAEQQGFDAALTLAVAESGSFRFGPQAEADRPDQATIQASITELLLEASCLQDESRT